MLISYSKFFSICGAYGPYKQRYKPNEYYLMLNKFTDINGESFNICFKNKEKFSDELIKKIVELYESYFEGKEILNKVQMKQQNRSILLYDDFSLQYDLSEEELFYLKLTGLFPNLKVDYND